MEADALRGLRAASTEPRSEDRGEFATDIGRPWQRLLQRSRGPKTAESGSRYRARPGQSPLQRSRGPKTAESPRMARISRRSAAFGFNGAAVRRPRRALIAVAASAASASLQRSRGPKTAESKPIALRLDMEPGCFNGAAVRRPRRAVFRRFPCAGYRVASTEPRSEDRGE